MKRFRCIVMDKEWKTCVGVLEARDLPDAKEQVLKLGYSVLKIRELEGTDQSTPNRFVEVVTASSPRVSPVEAARRAGAAFLKTFLFGSLGIITLLLFVFLLLNELDHSAPRLTPKQLVMQYMQAGFEHNWAQQYALLSGRRRSGYDSAENYALNGAAEWASVLYGEAGAVRDTASEGPAMRESLGIEKITTGRQQASVLAHFGSDGIKRKMEFVLVREDRTWKIEYIRDLYRLSTLLNFLASSEAQGAKREKVLRELREDYGFFEEEIEAQLRKRKIRTFEKRQRELDAFEERRAKMPRQRKKYVIEFPEGAPPEKIVHRVVKEGEPDPVNDKLDYLMKLVDGEET